MDYLKIINPHTRDEQIVFDEEPHIYYINGDKDNISVTTLVHKYFPKFDPDTIIHRMMVSKNWSKSKYHGMSKDEIKESWDQLGKDATSKGTILHKSIEMFYNNMDVNCSDSSSVEYKMFLNFYEEHKTKLKPYRTEWEVFNEEFRIAGSIDMIFENIDDGTLSIYDWKRTKEIKLKNGFGSKGYGPMRAYHDCNYVHYSLQLNIYKSILESKYGKVIRDMFLICMHPDYDNYKKYEVLDMESEIKFILDERNDQLKD
jgi:hypothetical protein